MSINLTANAGVASDVTQGGATTEPGVISTLNTTPMEESGAVTVERSSQNAPIANLGDFLQRRTLLKRYTFASTDGINGTVDTFDPHGVFFSSPVISRKTSNFHAFRGTFRITVTSTFPSGAYGYYVICAVPLGGPVPGSGGDLVGNVMSYRQALHVPHVKIRVENATDGAIDIPFIYPYDYREISTSPGLWQIKVFSLQPVSSAMADSTLTGNCTIYGQFHPDLDLIIPVQQGKTSTGTKVKHAAGAISSIAGALSAVPVIGEFAAPIAAGAAAVSSVLDWFGFTRTTHQKTPEPFIPRLFSNVANVDAEDTSEIAALSVANTISFDPRVGGGEPEDPGAFSSIFQHWTEVSSYTWTNAMDAGTVIGTFNVSPFFTDSCSDAAATIHLTSAGYVGLPFEYWRGDMEYMMIIPVSMFHRGIIQLVWTVTPGLGASDPTNQMYNIIKDVTGQEDLMFSVGYSKITPVSLSKVHGPEFPGIADTRSFNGQVSIIVVNPLRAPVDVANTVIRIYARARDNMQFGVPKHVEVWDDFVDGPFIQKFDQAWVLQQGAVGDGVREEVMMELVPSPGAYPACDLLWGEEFKSVRALMQKIEPMLATVTDDNWTSNEPPAVTNASFVYVLNHFPNQGNNFMNFTSEYNLRGVDIGPQFSFASWYSYLFVGIAGSTRYKVMTGGTVQKQVTASILNMDVGSMTTYSNSVAADVLFPSTNLSPDTIVEPHCGYEFTIPYYGQKKFYHTRWNPIMSGDATTLPEVTQEQMRADIIWTYSVDVQFLSEPAQYFGNKLYRGLGPDLRLVVYRFPPGIRNSYNKEDVYDNRV